MKTEYLGKSLVRILGQEGTRQVDLSERSGVSHSLISRVINHGVNLSPKNLKNILKSLPEAAQRESVVIAYLMDIAISMGIDGEKVWYSEETKSAGLRPDLLPLFTDISRLSEANPKLIKNIERVVLLMRASQAEIDAMLEDD